MPVLPSAAFCGGLEADCQEESPVVVCKVKKKEGVAENTLPVFIGWSVLEMEVYAYGGYPCAFIVNICCRACTTRVLCLRSLLVDGI